jgi:hyperosmotically inducible protein
MRTRTSRLSIGAALAFAALLLVGCDKATEAPPPAPGPAATVGAQVDDTIVTGRVKSALLADPDIKSFDINVVTSKGEVQLTGFVDNQGQIDRATAVARATEGAGSVRNELMVKP